MDNWYKDWFKSEYYLDVYRHRDDRDAVRLVNLISRSLKINPADKILDAACGAGRHSILLAEKGFNVTGFDLSLPLLKIADKRKNDKNLEIQFINADIRNICFNLQFDVIVNLFTSFGYFERDEENFSFMNNARKFLKPGGYFILDYFNGKKVIDSLVPLSERKLDDLIITEKRTYENNRVIKKISIEDNGNEYNFSESVRVYTLEEILNSLNPLGYKAIDIFGDYEGTRFDLSLSDRLIILFRR
jgi:2-polyprenyl-3-methyl-5-hydroxy-6-metoxy-1,4-benzoquinol methylase